MGERGVQMTPERLGWLEESIWQLDLPSRLSEILEAEGVLTVRDLLHCCPSKVRCNRCDRRGCKQTRLLGLANFGPRHLEYVFESLEKIGFRRT